MHGQGKLREKQIFFSRSGNFFSVKSQGILLLASIVNLVWEGDSFVIEVFLFQRN